MRTPIVFIVSGPAGVGKTTLLRNLLARRDMALSQAITTTTRSPRPGEIHGRDYYFVTRSEFENSVERGDFCEYSTVHGKHLYGLTNGEILRHFRNQHDLLLCMDVQGAMKLKEISKMQSEHFLYQHVTTIFLLPPPIGELCQRINQRGMISDGEMERRINSMREELSNASRYDYQIPSCGRAEVVQKFLEIYRCLSNGAQFSALEEAISAGL